MVERKEKRTDFKLHVNTFISDGHTCMDTCFKRNHFSLLSYEAAVKE